MKRSVKKAPTRVSNLKPDHQATLFPSLGYYDAKRGRYRALIHGRVFVEGKIPLGTRLLLRGLTHTMKASPEELASETFQRRIDGFLAAPGRRRRIVLQVGSQHFRLRRKTRRNGAFYGTLNLPASAVRAEFQTDAADLPMHLLRSTDDAGTIAPTAGMIHYVPPTGISVISDVDDTIKLTQATDKLEMLNNTFLRPFEVVAGMADLYRYWQSQDCQFHYVSSSPWQLYRPLSELCAASGFPSGSMHLRYFRVRDQMFKRFRLVRRNSKVGIIAGIFKRLPQRRFVLVGDSGEKDPEIYAFLARRFPRQVAAVLIRDLGEHPLRGKRLERLQRIGTQGIQTRVFTETSQIQGTVSELRQS